MASDPRRTSTEDAPAESDARDARNAAAGDPVLEVANLTKVYGDGTLAVDDVSFAVERGDFCVVIGPSGCGKSTTLHSIVGKVEPTSGRVLLDGEDVTDLPTYRRDVGLVFQDFQLFPHMTVEENVYYGLESAGIDRPEEEIESLLSLLEIDQYRESDPASLSAGQKQRVALVRSLVMEPKLLLLDEPLGDMDYKLQKRMERELLRIHRETDTTFVYVTHDQTQAMRLADQMVVLNGGRIEQSGSVDAVYNSPATAFVSTFVGDSNVFTGTIVGASGDAATVDVDTPFGTFEIGTGNLRSTPGEVVGAEMPFSVRPQHLVLSAGATNTLECAVDDVIHRPDAGTQVVLHVAGPDGERKELQLTSWERLAVDGETATVGWEPDDAVLLEDLSVLPSVDLEKDILGE